MGDRYIVIGVETVELAGQRCPLCATCLAVVGDEIVKAQSVLIDWTEYFPGPGDANERRPPNGGARLSGADWERALAQTGLPRGFTRRDFQEVGKPPAAALLQLHGVLAGLDAWGAYLVVHDLSRDLQPLADALTRCLLVPLPNPALTATASLELARKHGLRPEPGETHARLLGRVRDLGASLPSLEDCLSRHGLDVGVPPGHPHRRAMATLEVYRAIRRACPWMVTY